MKKKQSEPEVEWNFESALRDLEQTVHSLEQGNLSLEETLEAYENAIARVRFCQEQIQNAERKIEILRGIDKEGKIRTQPMEEGGTDLEEKQSARSKRRSV